jgi:hypothetical protein
MPKAVPDRKPPFATSRGQSEKTQVFRGLRGKNALLIFVAKRSIGDLRRRACVMASMSR